MNGIFDSHAHYDDERFDADRDELLESIHREGVEYIMTIGADLPTSYAARELAERYDFVYFAAGIHPEQAGDAPENYLEELKALAAHPKCRAIGEIGLDYYWAENPPKERQMELFRQQVLLAKELGLPVIIHDREAHADTLALLRELHPAGYCTVFPAAWRWPRRWRRWGCTSASPGPSPLRTPARPHRRPLPFLPTGC